MTSCCHLQDGENQLHVWMSHGDKVSVIPEGFSVVQAHQAVLAAVSDETRRFYGSIPP